MLRSSLWRPLVFAVVCVLLMFISLPLTMLPGTAFADDINPGVLPRDGRVNGLTYGQWGAKWWQWAFSVTTFDDCTMNQSGPVWFLAGTTGGSATRSCTVPAGKYILFPIFDTEQSVVEAKDPQINLPGSSCAVRSINGKLIKGTDYKALSSCVKAITQHVLTQPDASLEADITNNATGKTQYLRDLTHYRAASPAPLFPFTAVEGNPFGLCEFFASCPLHSKTADDGFWIILRPLHPGSYTLHWKATVPFPDWYPAGFTFTTEVTYNLQIK